MAMAEHERSTAAQALFEAQRSGVPTTAVSAAYPDADIDDAYRISMLVTEMKVADGRRVVGQKIGLTSKAMQELARTDQPDYGTLFDDWMVAEGSVVERVTLPT